MRRTHRRSPPPTPLSSFFFCELPLCYHASLSPILPHSFWLVHLHVPQCLWSRQVWDKKRSLDRLKHSRLRQDDQDGVRWSLRMEFSAVNRRRPSRESPLGPGAKKDGCFRTLSYNWVDGRDATGVTKRPMTCCVTSTRHNCFVIYFFSSVLCRLTKYCHFFFIVFSFFPFSLPLIYFWYSAASITSRITYIYSQIWYSSSARWS